MVNEVRAKCNLFPGLWSDIVVQRKESVNYGKD